ncbi:hypothetical protein GXN76_00840 [Kroppenstedtia pulmonis]|uniref:Uncharacterized protein n=1 Tax=Kroppenstedtia pulmonis TaxID=1380685 RepID=A0A7D3XQ38_9BACL|nr:hypothetical protein [Kroppenstedtia pulmonis]QKG83148.1 hypothetical protein GXN76_00840 [Kroppenstedtia pulmonis]
MPFDKRKRLSSTPWTILDGTMILEVPVQKGKIPEEMLDYANEKKVLIRDENGNVLNPKKK